MSEPNVFPISDGSVEFILIIGNRVNFTDAEAYCEAQESTLARIANQQEFELVEEIRKVAQTQDRFWIGMTLIPAVCLANQTRYRSTWFRHQWRPWKFFLCRQ